MTTTAAAYATTWMWQTGANDSILGNDGSCIDNTDATCPATLQGIEFSAGGYEVFGDAILFESADGLTYEPYVCSNAAKQKADATISTDGYKAAGLTSQKYSTAKWAYINKQNFNGEIFFAETDESATSATYTKDGFYKKPSTTKSACREWLAFGSLIVGSGSGGLSCLDGSCGLGNAGRNILTRLSPNGNRGELTA